MSYLTKMIILNPLDVPNEYVVEETWNTLAVCVGDILDRNRVKALARDEHLEYRVRRPRHEGGSGNDLHS